MKVLVYASNPHYTNLPDFSSPNVPNLELFEENIQKLIYVQKDSRLAAFFLALLHLDVRLVAHVTATEGPLAIRVSYLFTYEENDTSLFLLGEEGGVSCCMTLSFFSDVNANNQTEEKWRNYFLEILEDTRKKNTKIVEYSQSVLSALNKVILPAS